MNRDEIEGRARDWKGRAKQAAGTLIDDRRLESEGADERESGRAQADVGRARKELGKSIEKLGKKIQR